MGERPPVSPAGAGTTPRRTILVVEDDKDAQNLIVRLLDNEGYAVHLAADGVDALLQLGKRTFDLIIADVSMPNLDGMTLLDLMNQKGIKVPLIFVTSHTGSDQEKKGLELGALDYVPKPIRKESFLMRVKRILQTLLAV